MLEITNHHLGRLVVQTSRPLWVNYSAVNKHPRVLSLYLPPLSLCLSLQCKSVSKVNNLRGPVVWRYCPRRPFFFFPPRRYLLVFTTFTDRLHHLHMKRIEQHFSSTTDTLWLSRPRWTGTTLAMMTPVDCSPE